MRKWIGHFVPLPSVDPLLFFSPPFFYQSGLILYTSRLATPFFSGLERKVVPADDWFFIQSEGGVAFLLLLERVV